MDETLFKCICSFVRQPSANNQLIIVRSWQLSHRPRIWELYTFLNTILWEHKYGREPLISFLIISQLPGIYHISLILFWVHNPDCALLIQCQSFIVILYNITKHCWRQDVCHTNNVLCEMMACFSCQIRGLAPAVGCHRCQPVTSPQTVTVAATMS